MKKLVLTLALLLLIADVASGATPVPRFSDGQGPIVGLRDSAVSVKDPTAHGVTCTRDASSPSLAGFKIGVWAIIDCTNGVLTRASKRGLLPGDGKTFPGLSRFDSHLLSKLPSPGPLPTTAQCANAWNSGTPTAARRALAQLQPLAAEIWVYTEQDPKTLGIVPKGPVCWIKVALPGQQSAFVRAVWKHGTATNWTGIITSEFLSTSRAQFAVTSIGSFRPL